MYPYHVVPLPPSLVATFWTSRKNILFATAGTAPIEVLMVRAHFVADGREAKVWNGPLHYLFSLAKFETSRTETTASELKPIECLLVVFSSLLLLILHFFS